MDGFDSRQEKELKKRTSKRTYPDEAAYWTGVYMILFPDAETTQIPTPCMPYKATRFATSYANLSPDYVDEDVNYILYDESSDSMRRSDPQFLAQLRGAMEENSIDNMLNVFSGYQASIRQNLMNNQNLSPAVPLDQPPIANGTPMYPPLPLIGQLNNGGALQTPPMTRASHDQTGPIQQDSAYYTDRSAASQPDALSQPPSFDYEDLTSGQGESFHEEGQDYFEDSLWNS